VFKRRIWASIFFITAFRRGTIVRLRFISIIAFTSSGWVEFTAVWNLLNLTVYLYSFAAAIAFIVLLHQLLAVVILHHAFVVHLCVFIYEWLLLFIVALNALLVCLLISQFLCLVPFSLDEVLFSLIQLFELVWESPTNVKSGLENVRERNSWFVYFHWFIWHLIGDFATLVFLMFLAFLLWALSCLPCESWVEDWIPQSLLISILLHLLSCWHAEYWLQVVIGTQAHIEHVSYFWRHYQWLISLGRVLHHLRELWSCLHHFLLVLLLLLLLI